MRLILPVIYCKEESVYKLDSNIPLDKKDYIIKDAVFYRVDTIEYVSDNQCIVCVSGNDYRVNLSMEDVDLIIQGQEPIFNYSNN
jgi:hypothetical protein